MSFESPGGKFVQQRKEFHPQTHFGSAKSRTEISEGWIFRRSRLTEDDLEAFRQKILLEHRRKHYRVLATAAAIFVLLGTILYFLYF